MFPFWTVTNADTTYTNERSSRYGTEKGAISEAITRIKSGRTQSVIVMKSVKLVKLKPLPEIETIEIDD